MSVFVKFWTILSPVGVWYLKKWPSGVRFSFKFKSIITSLPFNLNFNVIVLAWNPSCNKKKQKKIQINIRINIHNLWVYLIYCSFLYTLFYYCTCEIVMLIMFRMRGKRLCFRRFFFIYIFSYGNGCHHQYKHLNFVFIFFFNIK